VEDGSRKCPKCNGDMVRGVLMSREDSNFFPVYWMDGEPVKRSLFGLQGSNLDISDRRLTETTSFRCSSCGLIECYAA